MIIDMEVVKASVLRRVKEYDHVSFAELERIDIDPETLHAIEAQEFGYLENESVPNLALGVARIPFISAINELLKGGEVHLEPCALMVYIVDGNVPKMPVAVRPPKNGYKELHWAPCVLRPGPHPNSQPGAKKDSQ